MLTTKDNAMPVETIGILSPLWKLLTSCILGIANAFGLTLTGFGIGAGLCTFVVMCMTEPTKTRREWLACFTSTVVCSFAGGAYIIVKYKLFQFTPTSTDAEMLLHMFGIIGIVFASGLPAWLIVRSFFMYQQKNKDKTIVELAQDVGGAVKNVKDAIL